MGLAGERVVNSYKFYAVFREDEEFTVRSESEELGTVVLPPPVGEKLALAGRVWLVEEIDRKRRLVYCSPVKGKVPAYFGECPGDIHTKILERMRQVLREDCSYPYLMTNAAARLAAARETARASGTAEEYLINLGGETWCLFPWLGTYAFLALERLIKRQLAAPLGIKGVEVARPYFLQFRMKGDRQSFFRALAEQAEALTDPMTLLYPEEVPLFEKYDEYLPEELVRRGFAYGVLNLAEMKERVAQMAAKYLH